MVPNTITSSPGPFRQPQEQKMQKPPSGRCRGSARQRDFHPGCLGLQQRFHGLISLRPRFFHAFAHRLQIYNGAPEPANGVVFGQTLLLRPAPQAEARSSAALALLSALDRACRF